MNQAKSVKVSIFGEQYTFISDEPQERVIEIAQKVDQMMKELAGKMPQPDIKKIAVLVAVQAVSEQLKLEGQLTNHELTQKHLIDLIDREMSSFF